MNTFKLFFLIILQTFIIVSCNSKVNIPLPEHPRPDFEREDFINLNGPWNFAFEDSLAKKGFYDQTITVPFSWKSELSGIEGNGDIAWYRRSINLPKSWGNKRVFVIVGASDWKTEAFINGNNIGLHTGGYTPFEFEITDFVHFGGTDTISFRIDDTYSPSHLFGKQGYGNVRGIWQTVYLEARGESYISSIRFYPDIDKSKVIANIETCGFSESDIVNIAFKNGEYETASAKIDGNGIAKIEIPMPDQHLWTLDDPYLYEVAVSITNETKTVDKVNSYFGQRKISTMYVPGQQYKYVALNNEPVYLKLCLDQSFHPEGLYTFPSDEFMKNEILIAKNLGLNGSRTHVKVEIPRKLYWADKLGHLIMADVPQFRGATITDTAKADWENCIRAQIKRDFNHPSIYCWVDFNETWGLKENIEGKGLCYTEKIQNWVKDMYHLTKSLDSTRLVEDNSAALKDHVITDVNSWHVYTPGYAWEKVCAFQDENTFPGSTYNFTDGNKQGDQPLMNAECGNVWGYSGSCGNIDYTWDYHEMMNSFHRHPKICGWLYTQLHDVVNEWNGYVKYDRSPKIDGLSDFIDGMGVSDFHSDYYIVPKEPFCRNAEANSQQEVNLASSFTTNINPGTLNLETVLSGVNEFGEKKFYDTIIYKVEMKPFALSDIANRKVNIPNENGIYELAYILKDSTNKILHRNFSLFVVNNAKSADGTISFAPKDYSDASWSIKSISVLNGLKINGFGNGYYEYNVDIPANYDSHSAHLLFEASSIKFFEKDKDKDVKDNGINFFVAGYIDAGRVENTYIMTDLEKWSSKVKVIFNGKLLGEYDLEDSPADQRGVLSWNSQLRNGQLRDAGSYGYLINISVPKDIIKTGKNTIRFEVPNSTDGGLSLYGKDFGRYPLDPTLVFDK